VKPPNYFSSISCSAGHKESVDARRQGRSGGFQKRWTLRKPQTRCMGRQQLEQC